MQTDKQITICAKDNKPCQSFAKWTLLQLKAVLPAQGTESMNTCLHLKYYAIMKVLTQFALTPFIYFLEPLVADRRIICNCHPVREQYNTKIENRYTVRFIITCFMLFFQEDCDDRIRVSLLVIGLLLYVLYKTLLIVGVYKL